MIPGSPSAKRPESDVSERTGLVGVVSLLVLTVVGIALKPPIPLAIPLFLVGTALPMIIWGLLVEKVHRRETTGLDFSLRHPRNEVLAISVTKLIGLFATFGAVGVFYHFTSMYQDPKYVPFFVFLSALSPAIIPLSIIYVYLTTRHMTQPRDDLWHFGKLISLDFNALEWPEIKSHLLSWSVKSFFLAFMFSILPFSVASILHVDISKVASDPAGAILFLVRLSLFFDVCFGTIGYILTLRVLDAHVRSANPYLSAWIAALACYPPFVLTQNGGPLHYRNGTQDWMVWLDSQPVLLVIWGSGVLALAMLYAWATVVFGIRFSNLTHRGIITNGPYRFFKHPAYLSKNIMWWMAYMPFLTTTTPSDALRNCVLLLLVNGIYFTRAKTEEQHLMHDQKYRDYALWIRENGLLPRLFRRRLAPNANDA